MNAIVAEMFGTFLMILLGSGVVANVLLTDTKGHGSGWIVITTAWALAVFIGVSVAGPYSGAHLNPAVTLSVWMIDEIESVLAISYVGAQFVGAMLGAGLVWLCYRPHFARTEDPGLTQAVFCTAPAIRDYRSNFLMETVATFVLIATILFFQEPSMQLDETAGIIGLGSIGALPVAFLVWGIGLALGGTTGYAINPVRDLGPRVVYSLLPIRPKAGFDIRYAWIPVIAPLLGSAIATWLYQLLTS
ncbi:aquaporin family protein [Sphingobacterium sp. lm-10]|uniref:MIP/aquaporin family protein n=1 Tax=Sphingobacterium sp. lm-10 TaxID=2944904 RepID=UPI0020203935|nr:MIP/aquaporin family protein [Sphingobacterium sp. lm-10]MCL7989173.1 aquaporin family protein [Sphingobacterium sp. lm-10]